MTTRDVTAGERTLTLDDVGDPEGVPVLYLHGTPDSRLSRHPDDGVRHETCSARRFAGCCCVDCAGIES